MSNLKELRSVDLSSYTIINTGISVLFSVILSIAVIFFIAVMTPGNIGVSIYVIPTIIVGTFICGIYSNFSTGLFYNLLAKKLRNIKFILTGNEITKISPTEIATITATIALIEAIIIYLSSMFVLPLVINSAIQTLMFSGQQVAAYGLYQLLIIISQPMTIIMFLFGSFVITFVFVLIGVYIYNIIASKGRGITVELSDDGDMTVLESIDMLKFAIAMAIISGILNLIVGIIMLISGTNIINVLTNVITGFIGGFLSSALIAIFYNFLAPKIGKLKLKLIDTI